MQATFEIGVFILGTAGLIWWIYKSLLGEDSLGEKLGMVGVKIAVWAIVIFLALRIVADNQPTSVPVLLVLVAYIGVVASFGFVVAGSIANKLRNLRIGREQRLSGFPTKPNLLSPWIPAVLAGFVSVCVVAAVSFPWFMLIRQQELIQGIQGSLSAEVAPPSFGVGPGSTMLNWLAAAVLLIVLVTYGFHWLRNRRAWREYEELCSGIRHRVTAALNEAQNSSDAV